jgi:hypothetical protein
MQDLLLTRLRQAIKEHSPAPVAPTVDGQNGSGKCDTPHISALTAPFPLVLVSINHTQHK